MRRKWLAYVVLLVGGVALAGKMERFEPFEDLTNIYAGGARLSLSREFVKEGGSSLKVEAVVPKGGYFVGRSFPGG